MDVDTGIDDAIAIMIALQSPEIEIVGITTVGGNVTARAFFGLWGRILRYLYCRDRQGLYQRKLPVQKTFTGRRDLGILC